MTDQLFPRVTSDARARPYGWIGLFVSLIAIVIVSILVWIAVVLAAFAVQIPFQGWTQISTRVTEAYQIAVSNFDVVACFEIATLLLSGSPKTPSIQQGLFLLLSLSGIAAVLIVARFRAGDRWRDLVAWHPWRPSSGAGLFVILLIVAVALNPALGWLAEYFFPGPATGPVAYSLPPVSELVSEVILAPVMEELLVRGWLYTALRAKMNAWLTIAITSALFALLHPGGSIVATLPLGLAAGYLRESTGSMKSVIAFHILHNALAIAVTFVLRQF